MSRASKEVCFFKSRPQVGHFKPYSKPRPYLICSKPLQCDAKGDKLEAEAGGIP